MHRAFRRGWKAALAALPPVLLSFPVVSAAAQDADAAEQISAHTLWRVLTPIVIVTLVFIAILTWIILRLRREVRQRRWTENELRFQTQFQKMLMNTVPIPIFVKDIEGRYVAVNPAYEKALGVSAEQLLGKTIAASGHAGNYDAARLAEINDKVLRTGEQAKGEVEYRTRDGTLRNAIYWLRLCRSDDDAPRALLGAFLDVSQDREKSRALAAAKAQAEELSRAKDIFLATVSHEIRTPMSGVVGILQLMNRERLSADERHLLDMARNAAEILMRVLNDILDFAKSQHHELQLEYAPFDIRDAVAHAVGIIAPETERKGIELETEIDPAVGARYLGDAHRLGQVLLNLLSNAVKFTEAGRVRVTLSVHDAESAGGEDGIPPQRLDFHVSDTGIGIAPQDQQHLFSPFMQADTSTSRLYGGTGLGLAICKRLVEAMGGGIALQSAPGAGTTVSFDILLKPAGADADIKTGDCTIDETAAPMADHMEASDNSPRVLLVEDQPLNRELLLRQMQHIGWTACDTAANGVDALAAMERQAYAMVITDCAMPVMNGLELIAEVRRRETLRRTVLVALTANATRHLHDQCLEAGADDVLTKPVNPVQLRELLQRFGVAKPAFTAPHAAKPAAGAIAALDAAGIPAARQQELWKELQKSLSDDLDALRQALQADDLPNAKDCAHRILSVALWFKLDGITGPAAALEAACDRRETDAAALSALCTAIGDLG